MGFAIHIHNSALSGVNIISILLLPFIIYSILKKKYTSTGWLAIFAFVLLIIFSTIVVFLDASSANLKLLRGALVASAAVWGSAWLIKYHTDLVPNVLYYTLLVAAIIGILQISYLLTGLGIDPAQQFGDETFYLNARTLMGVPSIFGNPNDFSVFSCLIFLFFLFNKTKFTVSIVLALFCIFISGSKTAILIAIFGLLVRGGIGLKIIILFFIFIVGIYIKSAEFQGFDLYAVDRTLFTIIELLSGSVDINSSVAVRYESWLYFFSEYYRFISGSFVAGEVFPQFVNARFDTSLIALNPHSFIIELHALFGFGGFLIFALLFIATYKSMSFNYLNLPFYYIFSSIFLLVNVSSSILGSGSTYALIAILAIRPLSAYSFKNYHSRFDLNLEFINFKNSRNKR